MEKKKIVLIQSVVAPYRFEVFKTLDKHKLTDFEVWFMAKLAKNRLWNADVLNEYKFRHRFIPGITLNLGIRDNYPFWINPFIFYYIAKARPDVLIIFGWDSLTSFIAHITCKLLGIKFIIWAGSTVNEKSWRRTLLKIPVKIHVKFADAVIAYGTKAKEYLIELGADPEIIFISYNTTNIRKYEKLCRKYKQIRKKTKEELGFLNKKVIMFYGQLIERKGADLLIEAFKLLKRKHKKVALLIVGTGVFKEKLCQMIKGYKLTDVKIIDNPGDSIICKYYSIADLFVLPSREEVWGLVVNESMACGLPVLVSDVCGSSIDLVENGRNGYVFKTGDVNSLTSLIEKALADNKKLINMGRRSKDIIKKFDPLITYKPVIEAINYSFKK